MGFWQTYTNAEISSTFDASYIKLREARLAYELPSKWLKKTPFGNVQVAVEGRNLLLLLSYVPHIDPEVNLFGPDDAGAALEFGGLPTTRSIGFNVRFTL